MPPQVAREGTKKTTFSNLMDICRRMHRQPEHVLQFLYSELGTTGSIDGQQRLIMKGRYTQKQIENVLRKYIGMSRTSCLSRATADPQSSTSRARSASRVTRCWARRTVCTSSRASRVDRVSPVEVRRGPSSYPGRSVSAIKAGYQAQIGKRIKAA